MFFLPILPLLFGAATTTTSSVLISTAVSAATAAAASTAVKGLIDYGRNTDSGGHDHRTNRGDDRTPAQKQGDQSRRRKE